MGTHRLRDALIVNASIDGFDGHVDITVADARIAHIAESASTRSDFGAEAVIDADGGWVLRGLHDHHLHLMAMGAARRSLDLASVDVRSPQNFEDAIRFHARADAFELSGGWLRVVGFHDSMFPELNRVALDRFVPNDLAVRVQHRGGRRWICNTAALRRLDLGSLSDPQVERDATGEPTGLLNDVDDMLSRQWRDDDATEVIRRDLSLTSETLASFGVTRCTDATPSHMYAQIEPLLGAVRDGTLLQWLTVTGAPELGATLRTATDAALVSVGPVKLVVADHGDPSFDDLCAGIRAARELNRHVAVHCVTRVGLVVAIAAFDEVGSLQGDRIEHGAIVDEGHAQDLARLDLTVVTQPGFVFARGDDYLREVEPDDRPHLYPCASLRAAGVGVLGSTDAPFGPSDPWQAMRTAVDRRTRTGHVVGASERIDPRTALDLFLMRDATSASPRAVCVGEDADLLILRVGKTIALNELDAVNVRDVVIPW